MLVCRGVAFNPFKEPFPFNLFSSFVFLVFCVSTYQSPQPAISRTDFSFPVTTISQISILQLPPNAIPSLLLFLPVRRHRDVEWRASHFYRRRLHQRPPSRPALLRPPTGTRPQPHHLPDAGRPRLPQQPALATRDQFPAGHGSCPSAVVLGAAGRRHHPLV